MGLKEELIGKVIFMDIAPLIYFIERNPKFYQQLLEVFIANDQGKVKFQTSTLTLLEVLVLPMKLNRLDLVNKYEQILSSSDNINIFKLNVQIAKKAAELRAKYGFKTPDAIQIATAIIEDADYFFTNDSELKKVTEIKVIALSDY